MVLKYIRKLFSQKQKAVEPTTELPPLPRSPARTGPEIAHRPIAGNLIDPDVTKIIHRLTRFGHTAYVVGGGVRDLLLRRTPKDFDIGTSALPQDVKKLFRNCRIIGRRFRLAHIFFREKIIEVATFRANLPVEEGGAPEGDLLIRSDNVFGTPQTDALRRDFTINALFYDIDKGNVIDYVRGLADLDAGVIRTIGDPDIRLREDPIRILRALRLAGRLGFQIEASTLQAIRKHREDIRKSAIPRVLEDMLRMLRGAGAEGGYRLMWETGVMEIVLPELHERLRHGEGAHQRAATFWKALHAIDLATARGTEFSNPTLIATLTYPTVSHLLGDGTPTERQGAGLPATIDEALAPVEQRLSIPRRDRDRLRQIFMAQKRFQGGRRGRRFSVSAFISRPFFPEAFDVFEILCSATGQHRDELHRWRARIAEMPAGRRAEAAPQNGVEEPRGRRHPGRGRRGEERRRPRGERDGGRRDQPASPAEPERPDLSEEDIALVYGTVLPPEAGAAPSTGRSPAGPATARRDDRHLRRRHGPEPAPSPVKQPSLFLAHPGEAPPGADDVQAEPGPATVQESGPSTGEHRPRRRRRRGGRKHRRSGARAPEQPAGAPKDE